MSKTLLLIFVVASLAAFSFGQDFAERERSVREAAAKYGSEYKVSADKFEKTVTIKKRFLNSDRLQADIWLTAKTYGKRTSYSYSIFMRAVRDSITAIDVRTHVIVMADDKNIYDQDDANVYYDRVADGWAFSSIIIPTDKMMKQMLAAEKVEIRCFYIDREIDPNGREVLKNMAELYKELKR